MSKETFKRFVRSHPNLVSHVNRGETTWQKLYEMYDLYGENNSIWNSYFNETQTRQVANQQINSKEGSSQTTIGDTSLK
ncbi:MAG: YlbD family protein, partial [Bacilli bacterium]|nr:YlbD family protein [Bacilli bacterium]